MDHGSGNLVVLLVDRLNVALITDEFCFSRMDISFCFELLSVEFVVMVDVCLYLGWYAGIGQFVQHFAEPGDPEYAPPVTKGETPVLSFLYICRLFACCCDAMLFYKSRVI